MDSMLKRLPNWLTYLRLLLVPVFVWLMHDQPSPLFIAIALLVFGLAGLTDYFDGLIARTYKATTNTGKLLDPLADKILVMAALVMMVGQRSNLDASPWVPAWMVVVLLAREVWITGLRAVAASNGRIIPAGHLGKIKTTLQMVAIPMIMLHYALGPWGENMPLRFVGLNLLFLAVAFSIWSGFEYSLIVLGENNMAEKDLADNNTVE